MCEPGGDVVCKSDEEIREWLSGKWIVLLYNQIRFDQEQYFEASRIQEARISYIGVNSQARQINPHKIQVTSLEL